MIQIPESTWAEIQAELAASRAKSFAKFTVETVEENESELKLLRRNTMPDPDDAINRERSAMKSQASSAVEAGKA